jgi:putative SOS response-associated peptidase YedK
MCYYSSISVDFKIIGTRFGAKFTVSESFRPVFSASAFTFPLMPVISNENPDQIVLMRWGLIPSWCKDDETALRIKQYALNARCETVFSKPMFKHCILSKRCLVLVDGFFEWRHVNGKRYPYYIRLTDHQPFALAGIWDKWQNSEGSGVGTFSVITTEANSLMAQVHNTKKRMPVILTREDEKRWIKNKLENQDIESMLKPYDATRMEAYPVDNAVSRLGFNTMYPDVLTKKEYKDLPSIALLTDLNG